MQAEDGSWSGITVDLWNEIAREIGVDYEFKPLDLEPIIKGVTNGTLDVVAAGLGVTAAREAMFDFSTPYLVANEAVAIAADQQPSLLHVFRRAFLTWSVLGLFLFALVVMLGGASVLWVLETRGNADHYGGKTTKALARSLFWSLMVLTGHDFPKSTGWSANAPATLPARLFGIFWMMVVSSSSLYLRQLLPPSLHQSNRSR